jgi:hypothetical protein
MLQLWDVLMRPRKKTCMRLETMPLQAMPLQAMPFQAMPLQAMPLQATPLKAMPSQAMVTNLFFPQTLASCAPAYSCHSGDTICTALPLQAVPLQALLRRPHFAPVASNILMLRTEMPRNLLLNTVRGLQLTESLVRANAGASPCPENIQSPTASCGHRQPSRGQMGDEPTEENKWGNKPTATRHCQYPRPSMQQLSMQPS